MSVLTEEQRDFLAKHRLCVVGLPSKRGGPLLTPVYYVMDGDDILISTTSSRVKAKLVRRNPAVSICVLHEEMPFPYVTVRGRGAIEEQGAPELMARIAEVMSGNPLPEAARPAIEQRARDEGRVVLRVTPESAVSTAARGSSRASA
jgi:PPOX class probable F420-dependent enzyme